MRFDSGSLCARDAAFAELLAARGIRLVPPAVAPEWADVDVHVRASGPRLEGRMLLRTGDAPAATRDVSASTCDEVLGALAFSLALAGESADVAASPPVAQSAEPSAAPAGPLLRDARASPPTAPAARPAWEIAAGGSIGAATGLAPSPSTIFVVFGDITHERLALAPGLRIAALASLPVSDELATRSFALQAGRIDACPLRFGRALALTPCVRLEIGRIQGRSVVSRLVDELWTVGAVVLRARVDAAGPLFLEAEGALGPSLSRPAFFGGTAAFFEVPPVVASTSVTVGAHFR